MLIAPVCCSPYAGGAERYLNLLSPRLADHGHSVHLIGSIPGWSETGLASTPVALGPKWDGASTLRYLPRLPFERRAVALVADELQPEVFHMQFKREQIGLTSLLARRAPVVWTEHGVFQHRRSAQWLARAYRHAARHVEAIICVSDVVAADVRQIVGPAIRLEVIPNAIDTSATVPPTPSTKQAARAALGVPAHEKVLAWAAQVHPGKEPLLAAATGRHFPGITLLAGDGPLATQLEARVDGQRVRYLGYQPNPSLLYQAADVFLFTSHGGEGYPTNSLLEAAAHGLPIVANAGAGADSALRGASAIIAPDDPGELANAAARLATRSANEQSRTWACAHDIHPWVAQHATLLRAVLGA